MSVAFIRSNFVRKAACAVCLYTLPLSAQQSTPAPAATPAAQSTQSQGAPLPEAPHVQSLPQPTHVDFSKSAPLLPNPFARFIPRDVPPPSFTNSPRIDQLIQNGKIMLSLNDAIAIALAD